MIGQLNCTRPACSCAKPSGFQGGPTGGRYVDARAASAGGSDGDRLAMEE
jgi:hypothetical protein